VETEPWPEPVERVAGVLRTSGVEARIEEFPEGTPTAADAARAAGCELGPIVKSLVVLCDGRPLLVLVPGDRRADLRKVAAAAGCSGTRTASPAEVLAATGFEAGAVAPFPLPAGTRVFGERTLLARDEAWIGAGSPTHLAAIAPVELFRLARAEAIDAVQE